MTITEQGNRFTVTLDADERKALRLLRARLSTPVAPVTNLAAFTQAVETGWAHRLGWAREQTAAVRAQAFARAKPDVQAKAKHDAEAASDAALGFDPEA